MGNKSQVLIDSDVVGLYCTGTDGDRDAIEKLYPGVFGGLKGQVFLNMIREYKNNPKSNWVFYDSQRGVELHIQITVEERPMSSGSKIMESV